MQPSSSKLESQSLAWARPVDTHVTSTPNGLMADLKFL